MLHVCTVEPLHNGHLEDRREWPLSTRELMYRLFVRGDKKRARCKEAAIGGGSAVIL